MSLYYVQRKVRGQWVTVSCLDWLSAQKFCDKLQNIHGANYVRTVRVRGLTLSPSEVQR